MPGAFLAFVLDMICNNSKTRVVLKCNFVTNLMSTLAISTNFELKKNIVTFWENIKNEISRNVLGARTVLNNKIIRIDQILLVGTRYIVHDAMRNHCQINN